MPNPKLTRADDLMVDLETLGTRPGCKLLSIGAVFFNPLSGDLGEKFYVVVNRESQERAGLHEDPATLAWWEKQGPVAHEVLEDAASPSAKRSKKVGIALDLFAQHCQLGGVPQRELRVWGNGASFDCSILAAAYHACNRPLPWQFWNERCHRTLRALGQDVPEPERLGTHHNALDDAVHQARHALLILRRHRDARQALARVPA